MRNATAILINKYAELAGMKSHRRQMKKAWHAMSHKERGKLRPRLMRAIVALKAGVKEEFVQGVLTTEVQKM